MMRTRVKVADEQDPPHYYQVIRCPHLVSLCPRRSIQGLKSHLDRASRGLWHCRGERYTGRRNYFGPGAILLQLFVASISRESLEIRVSVAIIIILFFLVVILMVPFRCLPFSLYDGYSTL
ncbi:hypothetical protein CDAR_185311 [Caerostris darwini]|uniref:Uncharacterized protein n=1 Tax=Caerostris darwini TaxID=1538125 RepID=A0AAV4STE7_9ARAC|nr:hypothetical protein CDAR_185311 [Caerostris darwini]